MTSATLLGFYYLFLDVLDLGANGYLLAMACSDALSAIFVFIAGHCHQYFSFKKFNKALWKDMLRYCIPMIPGFHQLLDYQRFGPVLCTGHV